MAEETKPAFVVNGKSYEVPEDLTLGEMCDAERYFGVEFGTADSGSSNVRMAAALLWISVKRQDDSVTIDDIRALPPDVFKISAEDDAGPPDMSAGEPNGSSETSGDASNDGGGDPARIPEPIGRAS
jgi:hypothetical protein